MSRSFVVESRSGWAIEGAISWSDHTCASAHATSPNPVSGNSVVIVFSEPAEFFIGMRGGASCPWARTLAGVVMRADQHI